MFFICLLCLFSLSHSRCIVEVNTNDHIGSKWSEAKTNQCSLHFNAGTHSTTSWLSWTDINGIDWTDPIEISGDGVDNTKLTQAVGQNIFNIGGSYFKLRDIELEGGDGGIRVQTATSNANFINLKIHGVTGHAFYTQQETQNILISNIEIYDVNTGSSDCFSISSNFHHNTMEYIYCHGNNVKDGISFWQAGSYSNIIKNNVIIGTNNRGIIIHDSSNLGNNIIQNNILLQIGKLGIHIFAGVELFNNIVHSISSPAISASDTTTPKNIKIIGNTIVRQSGNCMEADGWNTNANTFEIVNNLFLCGTDGSATTAISFSPSSGVIGTTNIQDNAFYASETVSNYGASNIAITSISGNIQDYANYNFYPKNTAEFLDEGSYRSDALTDVDCVTRGNPSDIGAYEYDSNRNAPLFYIDPDTVTSITFTDLCGLTANPTTDIPTTAVPTTTVPTTVPTTASPTTFKPTTTQPTTSMPTTTIAPTDSPITSEPTTSPILPTKSPVLPTVSPITLEPTKSPISPTVSPTFSPSTFTSSTSTSSTMTSSTLTSSTLTSATLTSSTLPSTMTSSTLTSSTLTSSTTETSTTFPITVQPSMNPTSVPSKESLAPTLPTRMNDETTTNDRGDSREAGVTEKIDPEERDENNATQRSDSWSDNMLYFIVGGSIFCCVMCCILLIVIRYKNKGKKTKEQPRKIETFSTDVFRIHSASNTLDSPCSRSPMNVNAGTPALNVVNVQSEYLQHMSSLAVSNDIMMDDIINEMETPMGPQPDGANDDKMMDTDQLNIFKGEMDVSPPPPPPPQQSHTRDNRVRSVQSVVSIQSDYEIELTDIVTPNGLNQLIANEDENINAGGDNHNNVMTPNGLDHCIVNEEDVNVDIDDDEYVNVQNDEFIVEGDDVDDGGQQIQTKGDNINEGMYLSNNTAGQ